jgi:predicted AlkP superfamily phosphohydrolase/phosphomutase
MPGTALEGRGGGAAAGSRIVVIGVDGADWRVIDRLISQGRLPTFERLKEEGATGILESMEPSASPSLWTTVATGVRPERHGISGFVVPAAHAGGVEPGGPRIRPVTSPLRRAPAFWNLVSSQDRRVGVIGWLVTWPAEPVNGYVVSSYLPYVYNWSTGRPLKGTFVEGLPRQTFPEGLMDELGPLKVRPRELEPEILGRFYEASRVPALSADNRACVEGFRWSLAADQTYRRIGRRLFERDPVDLFAIYFGGIDVASHRFWKFSHPWDLDYGVGAGEREVLGNVIDEYYIYIDRIIEEYLELMDEDDTLMVLSDHGFRPVLVPDRPAVSGHHRPEGILAILGRGAARARAIRGAGLLDILPTLLYLMELPIPSDLEGRILLDALDEEFTRGREPRFVQSYGDGSAPAGPIDSELDRNILERLRSLGYIQ